MQISRDLTSNKKIIEIVIVIALLGIGLLIYDFVTTQIEFNQEIERKNAGSGSVKESLIVGFLDNEEEMEIEVSEQRLSEKEIDDVFEQAIKEIDKTYLGKNESPDKVCYDLDLRSNYAGGLVKAIWQFDDYTVIRNDGSINQGKIDDAGNIITANVDLKYQSYEKYYSFSFVVKPFGLETIEGQRIAIQNAIRSQDEKTSYDSVMKLPDIADGMELNWKAKMNFRGLQILILGIITVIALIIGKKQEVKKQEKVRKAELEKDYPMIVSKLSILMGAGMSFRGALERICKGNKQEKLTAGYEELVKTYRQMNDGVSEVEAIEDLGIRSGQKEYRRLCMLLSQNIRKGSKELIGSLEKEEMLAFENRKQRAMKAGEEASTKLLLPMAGMLMIVVFILIVPAIMQMKI